MLIIVVLKLNIDKISKVGKSIKVLEQMFEDGEIVEADVDYLAQLPKDEFSDDLYVLYNAKTTTSYTEKDIYNNPTFTTNILSAKRNIEYCMYVRETKTKTVKGKDGKREKK